MCIKLGFNGDLHLKNHINETHVLVECAELNNIEYDWYFCDCGVSFKTNSEYVAHVFEKYEKSILTEKQHVCEICSNIYETYESLENHLLTHKNFQRDHCKTIFVNECMLKEHEKVHAKENSYACTTSEKSLPHLVQLKEKKTTNTRRKLYRFESKILIESNTWLLHFRCQYCDKRFTHLAHLKDHERVHTGERPYRCKNRPLVKGKRQLIFAYYILAVRCARNLLNNQLL